MPYLKQATCVCKPPHSFRELKGRKAQAHAGSVWQCPKCGQKFRAGVRNSNAYGMLSTWRKIA